MYSLVSADFPDSAEKPSSLAHVRFPVPFSIAYCDLRNRRDAEGKQSMNYCEIAGDINFTNFAKISRISMEKGSSYPQDIVRALHNPNSPWEGSKNQRNMNFFAQCMSRRQSLVSWLEPKFGEHARSRSMLCAPRQGRLTLSGCCPMATILRLKR